MRKLKLISTALVLISPVVANAGIISYSGTGGIAGADAEIDFSGSSLNPNDSVTTEFSGVTFASDSGAPRFNPCGVTHATWGSTYMLDNDFIASFGPGCATNATIDDFTATFDQTLQAASFFFFAYHGGNPGTAVTVSAFLGASLVDSFDIFANTDNGSAVEASGGSIEYWSRGWINISGAMFDSIHISENIAANYLAMDSLAYKAVGVPEPGTLALLGLGLVGIAARRRKTV